MSYRRPIEKVEDYTDAFLVTLFVFFFMGFWVIAAAIGYVWVAVTAYVIHVGIHWMSQIKGP